MTRRCVLALAASLSAWFAPDPCLGATVTSAAEVCAVDANPCIVTSRIDVADQATLDFGTRAVNVSGAGQFNFADGSGTILCGPFSASTTAAAIDANGSVSGGTTASGVVVVHARRRCSIGNPALPCVGLDDCQLGTCTTRRCSKRSTRSCVSDAGCQVGPCGSNKRCSGSTSALRCNTNADCDFGTCPAQLTCSKRGADPLNCTSDADCDFGSCSVGNASISMGGAIVGNSASPALVDLRAADSVTISKQVNLSSTNRDSDGGELTVEAVAGSVVISAKIIATGGGQAQGGIVELVAGGDVTISEEINVAGGDADGGALDVRAQRDAILGRSVFASSTGGAGFGGEILVEAGRDVSITGVSSASKSTLETNGHTDLTGLAGDGGTQAISAERHLSVGANTRMVARGSAPDGSGGSIFLEAEGDMLLAGSAVAKADGMAGEGGQVEISAGGTSEVAAGATFELTGSKGGGGSFDLASAGNVLFHGTADVGASAGGGFGTASIYSDADTSVLGTLAVSGAGGGQLDVESCRITIGNGGKLDNKVSTGVNSLIAHESVRLLAGSAMTAGAGGTNRLVYRSSAKPPVVAGTISPAATLVVDANLVGCPVCGNGEVDQGETCDDGNLVNGDGCSSLCQNEKCLAQTVAPGYPAVALCEDGKLCTEDFCNTALNGGTCRHRPRDCDDSIACTADSCDPANGNCLYVANHAACSDSNDCTDDFCSAQTGCATVANSNPCSDGDICTLNDQCSAKICVGVPIDGCRDSCGDGIVDPTEECDDGNATFAFGEHCGVGCQLIPCGKPTNSAGVAPKSSDALWALRAAVGQSTCSMRVCDVDSSGKLVASDAQRILRAAVGLPVVLRCPES